MKRQSFRKFSSLAILTIAMLGLSLAQTASAGPLNAASGKYNGKLSGFARHPISGSGTLPKTDAILKLPTGNGRVVMRIKGFERSVGKITRTRVRQGGNKVVLIGKTEMPKVITNLIGIGSITGPFKAVVKLTGAKATVRATTTVKELGGTAKGRFIGSK